MNRLALFAASLTLVAGLLPGCSGSDSPPVVTGTPTAAATDERRTAQSDTLTPSEAAQVSHANAEPDQRKKPDL